MDNNEVQFLNALWLIILVVLFILQLSIFEFVVPTSKKYGFWLFPIYLQLSSTV